MNKSILILALMALISACKTEGVKKDNSKVEDVHIGRTAKVKDSKKLSATELLKPTKELAKVETDNGIRIKWFEKGNGASLQDGRVYQINYDVRLENGTLVDGNQLLNKDFLPFLVGFGLQTKGWDIAFRQLKVGDFVEIYLPSKMARGEKGIKGLIPPNAANVIHVRVGEEIAPSRIVDGTKVWLLQENKSVKKMAHLESEITFHYMVGTPSNPKYDISYRKEEPFTMRFSDNGIVKGLKKALLGSKRADKMWIVVPPSEAYGNKGLVDIVKPNESVFYDIIVLEVEDVKK